MRLHMSFFLYKYLRTFGPPKWAPAEITVAHLCE